MIKISVAVADANALPSAFVVWRGIEESIRKAADAGYDGIELALKQPDEVNAADLDRWLQRERLSVSCISTGQVFAGLGLRFTDTDASKRKQVQSIFESFIDMATDFSGLVNIGRVRGSLDDDPEGARSRFLDMARRLSDYAARKNVTLLLEPVNRYEIDFIHSVEEGAELMATVNRPNMKLMPDVFHMNIEDRTIGGELEKYHTQVGYVHFADSNRQAPGWGHTDFHEILASLKRIEYDGWASVEILPIPDPDSAARQAISYLRPLVEEFNES